MKSGRTWLAVILMYFALLPVVTWATEEPSVTPLDYHPEWLACDSSSECTSIKLGCWYWQPVNKKYASQAAVPVACAKSLPPGPQPTVSCVEHRCENDPFTIRDWSNLEPYQKRQLVASQVGACRPAGRLINSKDDDAWTTEYLAMLEKSIREHQYPDNELLTTTVKRVVPCGEFVGWEQGQEKWQTLQYKNKSRRRVVVERVRPKYPLDDIYPPLIGYAKVFQQCGQNSSRAGVTFSGDMHVEFTMHPDGTIDPASVKPSYPGVAYMRPYLECAGTAFKKLTFPSPKDHQPIHVEALIQIWSVQP